MIRVGLDLRPTEPNFKAHFGRGIGRYTAEVTDLLLDWERKRAVEDLSFSGLSSSFLTQGGLGELLHRKMPLGKVTFETQMLLPSRIGRQKLDLVHFFAHGDAPARMRTPYLVTVLDLIPLRFPEMYRADKPSWRFRLARFLEHEAIARARGILAISECTKRDLVEMLHIDAERIIVTPLGVDRRFFTTCAERAPSGVEGRAARAQLGLTEFGLIGERMVLLYVGGIDPRKNIRFLLEVLAGLKQDFIVKRKVGESKQPPLLMMAGRIETDRHYPQLLTDICALGLSDDVRLLGFVPDEKLGSLFAAADLTVFPSLYEGFGLPVLESMAAGAPVVAGSNSSIPEVAGSAAVLLPDNATELWVREIAALLASPAQREILSQAGLKQARRFSWERTAELTLEAYRIFADRRPSSEGLPGRDRRYG